MGEGLVFSWSVFRPFHRDPLPKRDGGRAPLLFDQRAAQHLLYHDARASHLRSRLAAADRTHASLRQVPAISHLCDSLRNTARKPVVFIRAQGGNRELSLVFAESHGFKARLLVEDSRNFANHAGFRIVFQRKV